MSTPIRSTRKWRRRRRLGSMGSTGSAIRSFSGRLQGSFRKCAFVPFPLLFPRWLTCRLPSLSLYTIVCGGDIIDFATPWVRRLCSSNPERKIHRHHNGSHSSRGTSWGHSFWINRSLSGFPLHLRRIIPRAIVHERASHLHRRRDPEQTGGMVLHGRYDRL